MTIAQSFIKFLETKGYGIFGQNIFLYRVPNSLKTQTEILWVIPSGGQAVGLNKTGEQIRSYQFLVYYRSNKAEKVGDVLNALSDLFSCSSCVELEGFELLDLRVTQFPASQDLDSENRMVGFIQVQAEIYKGCE